MGGFNPINFIFNTAEIIAANRAQNSLSGQHAGNLVQNSNAAQNANGQNQVPTGNSSFSPLNYSTQNANLLQNTGLSQKSQILISTVEIEQRANYVKDLLNLPRDFETLLKQIQNPNDPLNQAMKDFSKLLQNGKINVNALSALLSDNSKAAVQKLMMTLATITKMGSSNVNQLKELVQIFSASNNADSAQTIKNVLMLYLPWLPLSIRTEQNLDFDIDIFDKIQGQDPNEKENSETVKIMIQTANYGNIMAELELAKNNEVDVFIVAGEDFPEKEVLEKFKKENKQSNLRTNVSIDKKAAPKNLSDSQNVKITASNFVSPKLVLAAHSLVKIIIDVDSSNFIINEEYES